MPTTILRAGDPHIAPVVCVHPVTGRSDVYRQFAAALAWPGPVLGIDAPEPAGDEATYRLSELARGYVDALDPHMPAFLLGWSLGGSIAAEMSRVIVARGGNVGMLGIVEARAHVPEMRKRPTDRDTLARFFVYQRALEHELTPPPPPATSDATTVLALLRATGLADDLRDEADLEQQLAIYLGLTRAFFVHHEQLPIPVTVHLFESRDAHPSHPRPPTLGWENHAPRVERHVVPGTHFTVLRPRHVPELAQIVAASLPSP